MINRREQGAENKSDLSVRVPDDARDGDELTVIDNQGNSFTHVVGQNGIVAGGTYTVSVPLPPHGGVLDVKVTLSNAGGSISSADSANIDIRSGDGNSIHIDAISEDTGANDNDFITTDNTLIITGHLGKALESDEVVQVSVNGARNFHTAVVNGTNWTLDLTGTIMDQGDHTIVARIIDRQQNIGPEARQVMTILSANVAPTVEDVAKVVVSEEGLLGGIRDTLGTVDTTDESQAKGKIVINDPDTALSDLKVSLTSNAQIDAIDGGRVTWQWDDNSRTLTGSAAGESVMTVTLSAATATATVGQYEAEYTVTLLKPVMHTSNSIEDVLETSFSVNVNDGQATTTKDFVIAIEDDMPTIATDANVDIVLQKEVSHTNLLVGLDLSNSMTIVESGSSRLAAVKQALNQVIDKYSENGNKLMVKLVTFGDIATIQGDTWMTVAQAKALIDTLQANAGITNYEDALAKMMQAFTQDGKYIASDNPQNVSVFLTDGQPNLGMGDDSTLVGVPSRVEPHLSPAETKIWTDWLSANAVKSYAYAVGTDVEKDILDHINPIAYDGTTNTDVNGLYSQTPADFANSMTSQVSAKGHGTGNGTVFIDDTAIQGQLKVGFGADSGYVGEVNIGGMTYTYNPATNAITTPNGQVAGNVLTVDTPQGGKLVIDMTTAKYTYTSATDKKVYQESMSYKVVDKDGDGATSNQVWNVRVNDVDGIIRATATHKAVDPNLLGLNAEFYGYNDRINPGADFRKHADDGRFGNLDSIADMQGIINGRNNGKVVDTNTAAEQGTPDVRFTATKINYGGVRQSLGSNADVAPNGPTTGLNATNTQLYNFLSKDGGTDAASIVVEGGLGKTTDAAIRIVGNSYFDDGEYDFRVYSDDGFRLLVDGVSVIEFNGNRPAAYSTVQKVAIKGGMLPVELLYWEQGSFGSLIFEYKPSNETAWKVLDLTESLLTKRDINLNDLQDVVKVGNEWQVRTGDSVSGTSKADTILGSEGRDHIFGGAGDDKLTGGGSADKFIFNTRVGGGKDTITDFVVGQDKIALSDFVNLSDLDVNSPNWLAADSLSNLAWDNAGKVLSYNAADGSSNSITFEGMNESYQDANAFLKANLADTSFHVSTTGANIALSDITDYKVVDLSGFGNNTLTGVTLDALKSAAVTHVKGDAGDTVNIGNQDATANLSDVGNSTWKVQGSVVQDGVIYDVWQNGTNVSEAIYIQQGINVI